MSEIPAPGNVRVLTATFKDQDGNLADPTTVTFAVKSPNGIITNYTPTHLSLGVYTYNLDLDVSGLTLWRPIGTGAVKAAEKWQPLDVEGVG